MDAPPPPGLELCRGGQWRAVSYRPKEASASDRGRMERGLTLSAADVSLLVLTVALAIFAALVIPAHPYFGTDTDAELAAQDWARQASLNSTQPVREQLSKVVSDAIAASSTAEIGRAASIAALVMASLHAASSWSTLEPWLRSK